VTDGWTAPVRQELRGVGLGGARHIFLGKITEKFILLFILLYLYIKFQRQIFNNERAVKMTKFLTDL
jgi:hypothetical protein